MYGTALTGGAAPGAGTVFRFTVALGPATATTKVPVNQPFFTEEDVVLSTPAGITALTLTVTVRITPGLRFTGMYQTVFGAPLARAVSRASPVASAFVPVTSAP